MIVTAPQIDRSSDRRRWVILLVLWTTYVVVFLNRLSVGPLGPFIKDALEISSTQVGMILSAASLGYLLTQLPAGWIADRTGARWPIAVGEIVAGSAMVSIFLLPTFGALLTLMFVTGVGCGCLAPSTTRAVVIWFPKRERAMVMGVKQTAVSMGAIVGAATLPTIALTLGWRYGFAILGVVAIAIGVLSLALYSEPPAPAASDQPGGQPTVAPLAEVLWNREIWFVAMGAFCLNWVQLATVGHLMFYLTKSLAFGVVAAGGLLAVAEFAGAVTLPVSGLISDRLFQGRRKPVFIAFAVIDAVMCSVLGLSGPDLGWLVYPVIFLFGVGSFGFGGIQLTLLSELGGRGGAAKAAGLGSMIGVVGSILGPIVFGHLVDATGTYQWAWLSSGLVALVAVALLTLLDEKKRKI